VAVVDRLVEKGLLVSEVRGATLVHEFSHPIIQEAVYDGIGAARRRAVHRSAARALMASGRRGLAAAHFARYAVPGDDEAIEALRVALADAEAHDNHREALAMLEVLLDLLPPGDRRWLDISDVLAWQTGWVIDHRADVGFGTALRAMRRISALLDATVPAHRRASAKFHLGSFLAWGAGEADEASDRIEEAMAGFEATGDARSLLLARNELGYVRAIAGDMPALDAISAEVSRHAEQSGDRVVQLQALCARAHALLWSGRVPDASGALDHALRIAEDDGNLYRVSYLRAQRAYERALCGEMDAVEGWLGAAREAHGAYLDTHLPDFSSFVHWLAGSLAASVQSGREALAWDGGHISRRRAFGACFAGLSALELGGTDEAASLASGARAAFGGRPWWFHSALPDWLDAALVAARAEPEGAVALLGPAVAHQARIGAHLWAEFMLAELAEAAVAAGDRVTLARAAALVEEARPGPAHPSTPGQRALRRVVSGALAALGRAEDPVAEWRAAATDFAASGWMMWEARARALLAAALGPTSPAAAGEREAAVAQFTGCGASRRADVLRRGGDGATGAAPGRASHSRGSLGELTPREREVAQLAAQGLSARSIGEQLFIGTRTVESHLAHVYAKLGVRSRIALSRLFAGEPSDQ
jgi:DNA-binding CsgD family transcriptional regulator/tetratricopeptide (TPR) repeat protein